MRRAPAILVATLSVIVGGVRAAPARACGMMVARASGPTGQPLRNDAITVVLMREGLRTVVSLQNSYVGPPEDFALVVPVPVVLQREQVRTLPRAVFSRIDALSAPRLVELREEDPCPDQAEAAGSQLRGSGASSGLGGPPGAAAPAPVRVESRFEVGEYDVVVLGASDSIALERWLVTHEYRIPEGASAMLRPYVEAGMKFFVARVDASRLRFESGRSVLSPIRFHYDAETFAFPIRPSLLNSAGSQDLVVLVLGEGRYEAANRPNVRAPTWVEVRPTTRGWLAPFYSALMDRIGARFPGAVVTEYAGGAGVCGNCTTGPLTDEEVILLGGDVLRPTLGARSLEVVGLSVAGPAPRDAVMARLRSRAAEDPRACSFLSGAMGEHTFELELRQDGHVRLISEPETPAARCIARHFVRTSMPPAAERSTARVTVSRHPVAAPMPNELVLTRLHMRYGTDVGEDLVLRLARPIAGGADAAAPDGGTGGLVDALELARAPRAESNAFETTFVVRHPWSGPMACLRPARGRWLPVERSAQASAAQVRATPAAARLIDLADLVRTPLPALGLPDGSGPSVATHAPPAPSAAATRSQAASTKSGAPASPGSRPATPAPSSGGRSSAGCTAARPTADRGGAATWITLALALAWSARRRQTHDG
ncbi:MAG: DUF2330 domain-containing protein [Deltaproteobacteria bacterium]|nr:DUF2330 domain-containing protein [Deltaproteobacteria bacterium]